MINTLALSPPPRRGTRALLVLAAGALAGLVWWLIGQRHVRREPGLSVLLITVDTLRADALGAYGNGGARTPWMDALAAAGVRFEDAHAHNVVTLPSHANILSGRYATEHGVRDNSGFRFPRGQPTLATLLKAGGYGTGAFVSAFPLDSRFGLAEGFDVYDDAFVDASARSAFLVQERPGPQTVARAQAWLSDRAGPSFCWVHIYEPHFPYAPPEPFASRFSGDPYHGEVAAADAALGPLLEPLLAAGASGRTLVVLTSDHGESLGEHGEATHGIFAYEATLRVPLILYQPRLLRARVVSQPARHVDLLPTVLDALSLPVPEGLPGRSLLGMAAGDSASPVTSYFEALAGPLDRGWAPLHGVIREGMKFVDLPIPELYDLRTDARELRNLAASQARRLDSMRALLAPLRAADRGIARGPETSQTRERLAALGYVASGSGSLQQQYTEEDDPKRLIALDAMLQEVADLHAAGDGPGALAHCRDLVKLRPQMPMSLLYLAQLQRESGDLAGATETLRKAAASNPGDTQALALLGATLTQAGRAREAADLLAPYAASRDPDVDLLQARALALASVGRFGEALTTLDKAREVAPSSALVLVNAGTVQLMAGERQRAREAFEAAIQQNPAMARAWSSLGVLAADEGRSNEGLERLSTAIRLDPRECDKLLAVSSILVRRGRAADARPFLELFVTQAPSEPFARDIERASAWLAGNRP
jgi:arylsulfatase A-like enzyme/Flp pilus assembly protein TadD